MLRNSRIIWEDSKTDLLILERQKRNHEFYYIFRGNKTEFWKSVT